MTDHSLARPTLCLLAFVLAGAPAAAAEPASPVARDSEPHRSPIALALTADGSRLLTANQTAGTVSWVDPKAGKVLHELATGDKPAGVAIAADGRLAVVTHWYGYDLAVLKIADDRLAVAARVEVGPEPRGVVLSPDGETAYVAVGVANEVVRVDVPAARVTGRLAVGREPRGLALTPGGSKLLVSNARSQNLSLVATGSWQVERTLPIEVDAANLRQVAVSADGKTAYVANMRNRGFATTANNIDLGWVLGQRLTRVSLDGADDFATLSLDPRGKAVADVHGVAVSPDGRFLAVSCAGTHEILIFRTDRGRLPWRAGGSRDLMPPEIVRDETRLRRVDLGGRPTEVTFDPDGRTLYVANYLADAVQAVDASSGEVVRTIALGGPREPSLARRGEALFHDATRSFNQWYSCNTCHSDGHTNGLDFDTLNDGRQDLSTAHLRSRKKVPTLRRVMETGPWTWHGWQKRLEDAMVESFTKSMQGQRPTADEVRAIVAYLGTLDYPKNPYRAAEPSPAVQRGEALYRSSRAACSTCHGGPELTDGKIHVAGLEERDDAYRGYNPPSLRGVYDKDPYLHDGRAKTMKEALAGPHSPEVASGGEPLTDEELDDLVAYLKTL